MEVGVAFGQAPDPATVQDDGDHRAITSLEDLWETAPNVGRVFGAAPPVRLGSDPPMTIASREAYEAIKEQDRTTMATVVLYDLDGEPVPKGEWVTVATMGQILLMKSRMHQ